MIVIVGMPRSGTTWVGRIFDSHPETLFRHEPDSVDRGGYSFLPDGDQEIDPARAHLERLLAQRSLKAAGSRPFFRKTYRGELARFLRAGCVLTLKGAERLSSRLTERAAVPDLASADYRPVIKSVGLGRAPLWKRAWPHATFIQVVRHPCGHVHSVLRGMQQSHLGNDLFLDFGDCNVGRRYGLDRAYLRGLMPSEILAWRWVVNVQRAVDGGVTTLRYEDFCASPLASTEHAFKGAGLGVTDQTERFLANSTRGEGSFFETQRDPLRAANAWRRNFDEANRVLEILRRSDLKHLFAD